MAKKSARTPAADEAETSRPDRFATYLDLGRTNQKLRTRDSLVSVAADLLQRGQAISVTEVADAARVSRTTAYRYFPTSEMLAAQATLAVASAIKPHHLDQIGAGPGTPAEKLDAVIKGSHELTTTHEASFRALLRFTVDGSGKGLPPRPTFRKTWIEGALGSLKKPLGTRRFNRLVGTLCMLCGIEPIVVLGDICRMSPADQCEAKRWAAQQLLKAALAELPSEEAGAPQPKKAAAKKAEPKRLAALAPDLKRTGAKKVEAKRLDAKAVQPKRTAARKAEPKGAAGALELKKAGAKKAAPKRLDAQAAPPRGTAAKKTEPKRLRAARS